MFQYCEMDTDSAYIALAGDSIDDLVTPEHRKHYFKHRSEWLPAECCDEHKEEYVNTRLAGRSWTATESCCLARKAFDKRTPGLFKVEWCGNGFIGLCSKTYYCFGETDKSTTKGLSKRHNVIDKDVFLAVLTNRRKKKKKKKKLYSTPNRQMYKLQYLTYQIYNLSNYVRTYIDIMCINIHRRYKKMININNVLWGR